MSLQRDVRAWVWVLGVGAFACAHHGDTRPAVPDPMAHAAPSERPARRASSARPAASHPLGDRSEREVLFRDLVARVRAEHAFAPQTARNLGFAWEATLPDLEREFVEAPTRAAIQVALEHFQNSLHDVHCHFTPSRPGETLTAPVTFDAGWSGDQVEFRVRGVRHPLRDWVRPGDRLLAVDGVPIETLWPRWRNVSNANNWRSLARDVSRWLFWRNSERTDTHAGDRLRLRLQHREGGAPFEVDEFWAVRHTPAVPQDFDEFRLPYENPACAGLDDHAYGSGYALAGRGRNFCLYTSSEPTHRDVPIVRYFSFMYEAPALRDRPPQNFQEAAIADHEALRAMLANLPHVRGVVLDLRDNAGGNDPNWFLDWFAPAPYVDRFLEFRLIDAYRDPARLDAEGGLERSRQAPYLAALASHPADAQFAPPVPFFCPRGCRDCAWDNRYVPQHPVTTAPVALLVGPGCVSSCDSFAQVFDEFGFGPLVGEPTAAAYTSHRSPHTVSLGGTTLGTVQFAFSRERSGRTRDLLEGVPLHLDAPIDATFENRSRYDALLVEAALRQLATFPFPARVPVVAPHPVRDACQPFR